MQQEEFERVGRLGAEAWKRLKKTKDYSDWVKVGEAVVAGQQRAMNQAGTNRPEGKGYNMCFGEFLREYKLEDVDKAVRSRLVRMMEALPQVEQWRATLTLSERLTLNHPTTIMRKFKTAFEVPDQNQPKKATARDRIAVLDEENAQHKAYIAELEADRNREDFPETLDGYRAAYLRKAVDSLDEGELQAELGRLRKLVTELLKKRKQLDS